MSRTLIEYSNSKKYIIDNYKNDLHMKDSILVDCQQMIESLLKQLLINRFGRYEETHSIHKLLNCLDLNLYRKYKDLAYELTNIYYVMGCNSVSYKEYSDEDYFRFINEVNDFRIDVINLIL